MKNKHPQFKLKLLALACAVAAPAAVIPQIAIGQQALEEVIVTARKREEGLQDIPVTVTALGEDVLARGGVSSLLDVGRLVPNMTLYSAGSGSGSAIYLRGIGSSTISAAFDPAVALNIDGVVLSASRMIVAGQLDMRQIEVLKGPQSLYFGKSATAGVVSILTNDPGEELEIMARAGYSPEHEGYRVEGVLSGPITDTFGARLAVSTYKDDELRENIDPRADSDYRGRESTDARLTLQWDVTDNFSAKFKGFYSDYEDDGPSWGVNLTCPEGQVQQTTVSTAPLFPPGFENCKVDEKMAIPHVDAQWLPDPDYPTAGDWNNGTPYSDQDTYLASVQLDWDINENLSLQSITAYLDLENNFMEVFDYTHGNGTSHAKNKYESWSQEFRLDSSYDGNLNFSAGAYYADITQDFITGQNAVNIGLIAPDPVTGNRYDWDKEHYTDTDSYSAFAAVYWDINDTLSLTAGGRYSKDEKKGSIVLPYMHTFLVGSGFLPSGTVIDEGLDFDDDQWSPEVSLNWAYSEDVNLYVAYKSGYKSGGFDNSALPSASLGSGDVTPLLYDSETSKGGEAGVKSDLMDGTLRLNAAVFYYLYEDLQVQLFDASIIQFSTFNAGEVTTKGAEVEMMWATPINGLQLTSAIAYTDAEFTDEFINDQGDDLDGEAPARTAEWAGNAGFTFDREIAANWMIGLSGDARYSDDYKLSDNLDANEQSSYWMYDASIRLYSADNRYELAVIGRNLSDEVIEYSNQARPFACKTDPAGGCFASAPPGELDQVSTGGIGRQYTLQFTYRY